jgi:hypothetical protein
VVRPDRHVYGVAGGDGELTRLVGKLADVVLVRCRRRCYLPAKNGDFGQ